MDKKMFTGKTLLITGATGSLGTQLTTEIMTGNYGIPKKVIMFSRDENKQYEMKLKFKNINIATDEVFYHNLEEVLDFRIGDIKDYESMVRSIRESDIILHTAALKHVPITEYYPFESVKTNVLGTYNIIRALIEQEHHAELLISISSDKSCKPVNVYGMSKAIQERLTIEANIQIPNIRCLCVRYGNVVASRGSIIPLYREQIKNNQPLTITVKGMTRFWLTLKQASDIVFDAIKYGKAGDTFIPQLNAFCIDDLAEVMRGNKDLPIKYIGIRPGEKMHELLISEEELSRTTKFNNYYIINPILPELQKREITSPVLIKEYSSADSVLNKTELERLLRNEGMLDY